MKKYENVVWDWNGTLLDDVSAGKDTLNRMLEKRQLPRLTLESYREIFGFPVIDFYQAVGFDFQKETLHEISVDFVDTYNRCSGQLELNPGIREVLEGLKAAGIKQYVLSALREDLLKKITEEFGIAGYFEHLCGSDNIYASGKIERGERMLQAYGLNPGSTLMVGDTVHDAEVAEALGFDVVLYTGGHNSEARLREKAPVISRFEQLLSLPEVLRASTSLVTP